MPHLHPLGVSGILIAGPPLCRRLGDVVARQRAKAGRDTSAEEREAGERPVKKALARVIQDVFWKVGCSMPCHMSVPFRGNDSHGAARWQPHMDGSASGAFVALHRFSCDLTPHAHTLSPQRRCCGLR